MTKKEAYERARFLSKRDGSVMFIVLNEPTETGYDIADNEDMETFYLGSKPIDAFVNGELDRVEN